MTQRNGLFAALAILMAATAPAFAQEPATAPRTAEEGFQDAYLLLTQADAARDNRRFTLAIDLYRAALDRYIDLAGKYPDWQPGVVRFRLSYCDDQLKVLLKNVEDGTIKLRRPGESGGDPAAAASGSARDVTAGDGRREATRWLAAGHVDAARDALMETLREQPDNIAVRLLIGVAQCESRRFDDAVFLLENLIEETPDNADAHVILGTAYFGSNRPDEAATHMKKAIELDPSHKEAHFNLAQIMLSIRPPDVRGAGDHYRRALALGAVGDTEMDTILGLSVHGEPKNDQQQPNE